jgi:hypothetical protein
MVCGSEFGFPARNVGYCLLLAVLLIGTGCSDAKRVAIHGSVSYQGTPVAAAIVKVYGPGDNPAMAYVRDGAFRMTDVTPGEVKVTVEPDPSAKATAIPKKYASLKTSDLVYTITSSTRDLTIDLN